MNLKKGKFKIVEGTRVRMVSSKDTHIVEGAYGTVVSPDDKVLALGLVEVCALQGCEDGPKIPKSKMGIIIKELKAMFPAADGKQIADLVKSCVV